MSYIGYTIINPHFHTRWVNNIRRTVESYHSLNIICYSRREIEFCTSILQRKVANSHISAMSSEYLDRFRGGPTWVRWMYATDMDEIVIDKSANTSRDESMLFTDVFEVNWTSEGSTPSNFPFLLATEDTAATSLREESDTIIIHSKINYNVIQAET